LVFTVKAGRSEGCRLVTAASSRQSLRCRAGTRGDGNNRKHTPLANGQKERMRSVKKKRRQVNYVLMMVMILA